GSAEAARGERETDPPRGFASDRATAISGRPSARRALPAPIHGSVRRGGNRTASVRVLLRRALERAPDPFVDATRLVGTALILQRLRQTAQRPDVVGEITQVRLERARRVGGAVRRVLDGTEALLRRGWSLGRLDVDLIVLE